MKNEITFNTKKGLKGVIRQINGGPTACDISLLHVGHAVVSVFFLKSSLYTDRAFFFPHPYPAALAIIYFPAVFIFIARTRRTFRENRGSVNRLKKGCKTREALRVLGYGVMYYEKQTTTTIMNFSF